MTDSAAEYAIILGFDPSTEKKLKALRRSLRDRDIVSETGPPYWRPHITLAGLGGITREELAAQLQAFAGNEIMLEVRLDAVGTFAGEEGVVYIAPVVTGELLAFHRRLLDSLDGARLLKAYYAPDRWIPHCTMALNIADTQIPEAVSICHQSDVFGLAQLVKILLVEFPAVEEVGDFALE